MLSILLPMFVFCLAGAITPGPVNVIAAHLGARLGFWGALPHVLGASLSYAAIVWLVGSGLSGVLLAYPALAQGLQYLGAAYLLYLSARIARAAPSSTEAAPQEHRNTWLQGVLSQSLNPKAWLVALSGVGLFVATGPDTPALLRIFCAMSGLVCCVSVGAWAALGTLLRRWLAPARHQLLFNRAMALMLVAAVAAMLA